MVEHYRSHVRRLIHGKAKAMVLTASRAHAVMYKRAFDRYLEEQGYHDIRCLVAFSGKVPDPDDRRRHTGGGQAQPGPFNALEE